MQASAQWSAIVDSLARLCEGVRRVDTLDDLDVLHSVTAKLAGAIESVAPDQWMLATPCTDWDVTALVDHITGGNWYTVAILAGATSDEAVIAAREKFADGVDGSDVAVRSLRDQIGAFRRPQVLDQIWSHVAGDLSGRQILRLRLHDLIVHSWDVVESLQAGATLPDDLVRWGLDDLAAEDSLAAQHFGLARRLTSSSAPGGSSRYLSLFGR